MQPIRGKPRSWGRIKVQGKPQELGENLSPGETPDQELGENLSPGENPDQELRENQSPGG